MNEVEKEQGEENTGTASQQQQNTDNSSSQAQVQQQQERMFSQSQVSSMMAREKGQGRSSVYNELGIDPNDKETIELVKALVTARSQAAPPTVEQVQQNQQMEARALAAEQRAVLAEMKTEALAQGAGAQYVDDIVVLATAKLDVDGKVDFKTVLGEIRAKYPQFFNVSDATGKDSVGERGTGSSVGSDAGKGDEDQNKGAGLGARLAAQRRAGVSNKSSFWNI